MTPPHTQALRESNCAKPAVPVWPASSTAAPRPAFYLTMVFVFVVYGRFPEIVDMVTGSAIHSVRIIMVLALLAALLFGGAIRPVFSRVGICILAFTVWLCVCTPFSVWRGLHFHRIFGTHNGASTAGPCGPAGRHARECQRSGHDAAHGRAILSVCRPHQAWKVVFQAGLSGVYPFHSGVCGYARLTRRAGDHGTHVHPVFSTVAGHPEDWGGRWRSDACGICYHVVDPQRVGSV